MEPINQTRPQPDTGSPPPPTSGLPPYKTKTVKDLNLPGACPACGGSRYFRQELPVDHPDFGTLVPCPDCYGQHQSQVRRQQSQLDGRLALTTFDNYKVNDTNRHALEAARAFAGDPHAWLTLWGNYGTGKTHLLTAIVNDCLARNIPAVYYTLPDLLSQFRKSFEEGGFFSLLEYVYTVQILALDELDKVNQTDWAVDVSCQFLDARYRRQDQLGTVFALNSDPRHPPLTPNDSRLYYLFSRMTDEHSQIIHLSGPDARPLAKTLWQSQSAAPE